MLKLFRFESKLEYSIIKTVTEWYNLNVQSTLLTPKWEAQIIARGLNFHCLTNCFFYDPLAHKNFDSWFSMIRCIASRFAIYLNRVLYCTKILVEQDNFVLNKKCFYMLTNNIFYVFYGRLSYIDFRLKPNHKLIIIGGRKYEYDHPI